MKKFLFIINFGLLLTMVATPLNALASIFSDVDYGHRNYKAIESLSNNGMIQGYRDGRFKPDRTIHREEAVKLIVLATQDQSEIGTSQPHPFNDVQPDRWSTPYINVGYQNGIINGYPDGQFKPKKNIRFGEGLKIILEAYEVDLNTVTYQDQPLIHMSEEDWYAPYFNYAYQKNLINRHKYYHPKFEMTRGDFAEVLYRLNTINQQSLNSFDITREIPSNEYTVTIPKLNIINLRVSFADLYDSNQALSVLKGGLGHYLSPPDAGEKMILFGHSSGYNWDKSAYKQILRGIDQLQDGDRIYINYRERGYIYAINGREVLPAQQLNKIIANKDQDKQLTMYTCWPPDQVSHRYIIYAKPITG